MKHEVERGAKLLDVKMPGWAKKIDIDHLAMDEGVYDKSDPNSCGCIIAQLYGVYDEGLEELFGDETLVDDADHDVAVPDMAHGFYLKSGPGRFGRYESPMRWAWLRKFWVDQIQKRLV